MTGVTQKIANARQVGGDHYKTGGIELWDLFGPESIIFYTTRYLQRWRKKDGVRDLEKALHCVEKLREIMPHHAMRNVLTVDDSLFESWMENTVDGADERAIIRRIVIWYKSDMELEYAAAGIRYLIRKEAGKDIVVTGPITPCAVLEQLTPRPVPKSKQPRDMTDEKLDAAIVDCDKEIAEYPQWSAYYEIRKELRAEKARRERRVPRYAPPVGDTPSCGDGSFDVQHMRRETEAALNTAMYAHEPWVITTNMHATDYEAFYKQYSTNLYVLEPHVISSTIPRRLREVYILRGDGNWTLDIRKCPKEVRDYFPNLEPSMHMKQWEDETPEWQRVLYTWSTEKSKYELTDMTSAWHVEEGLDV